MDSGLADRADEYVPAETSASPGIFEIGRRRGSATCPDDFVGLYVTRFPPFQTNFRSIRELPIVRVSFRRRL